MSTEPQDKDSRADLLAAHDEALRKSRERLLKVQLKQMHEAVERIRTICNGIEGTLEALQEEWANE